MHGDTRQLRDLPLVCIKPPTEYIRCNNNSVSTISHSSLCFEVYIQFVKKKQEQVKETKANVSMGKDRE